MANVFGTDCGPECGLCGERIYRYTQIELDDHPVVIARCVSCGIEDQWRQSDVSCVQVIRAAHAKRYEALSWPMTGEAKGGAR